MASAKLAFLKFLHAQSRIMAWFWSQYLVIWYFAKLLTQIIRKCLKTCISWVFQKIWNFESLGPVHGGWEEWNILRRPDGLRYCGGQRWRGCLGNPQTPATQHWPRNAGYFISLYLLMVFLFDWLIWGSGTLAIFHSNMYGSLRSNTRPLKPLLFVRN